MKPKILQNQIKSLIILFILSFGIAGISNAQQIRVPGTKSFCLPVSTQKNSKKATVEGNQQVYKSVVQTVTIYNTDFVSAGVGGLRNIGSGTLTLAGVTGPATQAYLFWHGLSNLSTDVGSSILVNGNTVNGVNIGYSDSNCRGFSNSQAYRADVTSLVQMTGNGAYNLSGFGDMNANGASLIVFFNDGNSTNNRDVVIFNGNDSNIYFGGIFGNPNAPEDPEGWNVLLNGINYTTGDAHIQLHVADGQPANDAAVLINAATLVPAGPIFEGNTVPGPQPLGSGTGNQWDIRSFDITSYLNPGPNNLQMTTGVNSDCLGLIAALIDLPAGAAPPVANIKFNYPPTPDNGHVFNINAGDNLSFSVSASLIEMPANAMKFARVAIPNGITLSAAGLPAGASFPTVSHVNPAISTFSWSPTPADIGSRVVSFIAKDESNDQQITTSVIINVNGDVESAMNAPQNLHVNKVSCNALKLTWSDIIGSFEESYEVYRSSNGAGGPYQLIATPIANVIEYIDNTVWPNATFHYYVRGRFSSGFSPNSNIAIGTTACDGPIAGPTGPISGVKVYPISCSQFSIQWKDVIGRDEESYELYRSKNTPDGPYVLVATPAANTILWVDGHLESNTKYYYILRARFGDGFSGYTLAEGATTNKINLRLTSFCATKAVLDWDICTSQREKWRIQVSLDNVNFSPLDEVDALVSHYEAKNLKPNTKYYFAVQPSYSTGYSNFSNVVEAPLLKFPHPSDLKAAIVGNKINLSWVDNSSACDNEEQFVIYKKDTNDKWVQIGTADANKLAFTDSNAVAGKTYCYAVKARYFMGFEESSNEACITIPANAPANAMSVESKAILVIENKNANSKLKNNLDGDSSVNLNGKENRTFISVLNIYPNPVSNLLKFALNHQIDEKVTVKIFDSMGKEKLMSDFDQIELNKEYAIDISSLNVGLFFLSVQPKYSFRHLAAKFSVFK